MGLFFGGVSLWVIFNLGFGLCSTSDKSHSISVTLGKNPEDIVENDMIVFMKRPTERKPSTQRPTTTTSPTTTTTTTATTTTTTTSTTTSAPPQRKGSVKRVFKFKTTITKVYRPKVDIPDWFKFLKNFNWSDFQRRQKNNRCPWC